LLKDKSVDTAVFTLPRKMKPMRQIEAVERSKKQTVDRAAGGSPKLVHSHGEQLLDMAKREKLCGSYFTRLVRLTYLTRQLMSAMNNYTARYAHALLAATRQDDLAQPERPKKVRGLTAEQMARMASLLRGSRCPRIKHSPAGDRVVESGCLRQDKLSRLRGLCANLFPPAASLSQR
jgi:hypothetical protein